jgi:hypothetical protein
VKRKPSDQPERRKYICSQNRDEDRNGFFTGNNENIFKVQVAP